MDVIVVLALDLPGSSGLLRGESALLTMVSGGGRGRRTRPMQYPAVTNANTANSEGRKRSFRSRDAHSLQNLRLVQTCQRSRSNFVPHCEQKFGLYTVRTPSAGTYSNKLIYGKSLTELTGFTG
jgi:hypothetical protein